VGSQPGISDMIMSSHAAVWAGGRNENKAPSVATRHCICGGNTAGKLQARLSQLVTASAVGTLPENCRRVCRNSSLHLRWEHCGKAGDASVATGHCRKTAGTYIAIRHCICGGNTAGKLQTRLSQLVTASAVGTMRTHLYHRASTGRTTLTQTQISPIPQWAGKIHNARQSLATVRCYVTAGRRGEEEEIMDGYTKGKQDEQIWREAIT
jgi:hypothetical protein